MYRILHFSPISKWIDFIWCLALNNSTLRSTQVSREFIFNQTSLTHPGFSAATTSPTFSLELRGVGLSSRSYAQRPLAGRRRERWGICLSKKSVKIFFINNVFAVLIESWKLNVPRLGWQILLKRELSLQLFLCMMWVHSCRRWK